MKRYVCYVSIILILKERISADSSLLHRSEEFSEASLKAQQKWRIVPARRKEQERMEREEEKAEERRGRREGGRRERESSK